MYGKSLRFPCELKKINLCCIASGECFGLGKEIWGGYITLFKLFKHLLGGCS